MVLQLSPEPRSPPIFFATEFFARDPFATNFFTTDPFSSEVPLATVFFHQRYTFATEFFCQRNISPPLHFHQSLLGKKSIKSTENLSMHKILQICKSINEIVEIICHQVVSDQEGRVFALWIWCTSEFQERLKQLVEKFGMMNLKDYIESVSTFHNED